MVLGPLVKNPNDGTILRPFVLASSWPWSHKAADLQHHGVDRSLYAPYASGGYTGYLLNPPAPVWDQRRPVEVEFYERFLQEAWWQDKFQRFGHQALRLNPPFNALMVMPAFETRLMFEELRRELHEDDYEYIRREAWPEL